ncbi:MAG: hypothetical protein OEW75_17830, partial [Cyclobacteriaceae bacterium]|nr:hypothetical protein [Cyclobacteriaceae bacterium]
MGSIKFWNDFSPLNKWVYGILSSVLILSFTFMVVFWILGVSTIITWETALFSEMINTPITDIISYPFSLVLSVDSITFNEYMQGSDLTLSEAYAYAFLLFFWVGIICFITISTYMSRIWYLISSSLFIIIVMVIKPDLAFMIGNGNWVAGTMMLTFLGLSYYFQSFNKNVDLHRRLLAFSGLAILFSVIAGLFSNVEDPFLFLAAYGYPIPFILTIVAIFMVGHEIIAGLLTAVTRNASSSNNNWKHFFFISIIYLTNVALMYMNEINMIEWKLLPISPIFFFVISYIIGIWGFKQREGQYNYLFIFKPQGAIFYLAMGIIAFGTI